MRVEVSMRMGVMEEAGMIEGGDEEAVEMVVIWGTRCKEGSVGQCGMDMDMESQENEEEENGDDLWEVEDLKSATDISVHNLTSKLFENLQSEIQILKSLSHRHITKLLDIVRAERHIYLIMEYCAGGDLTNYIKKRGRVEGLEYVSAPGAALQYYPHPRTGGLDEIAVRSFLRQLAWSYFILISLRSKTMDDAHYLLLPSAPEDWCMRGCWKSGKDKRSEMEVLIQGKGLGENGGIVKEDGTIEDNDEDGGGDGGYYGGQHRDAPGHRSDDERVQCKIEGPLKENIERWAEEERVKREKAERRRAVMRVVEVMDVDMDEDMESEMRRTRMIRKKSRMSKLLTVYHRHSILIFEKFAMSQLLSVPSKVHQLSMSSQKCPEIRQTEEEARHLWDEAKLARESYEEFKATKLKQLQEILDCIDTAEDALNRTDHYIGNLHYTIKKLGFKPPRLSGESAAEGRRRGQQNGLPQANQKENFPPSMQPAPNTRPVRAGAGKHMASLIAQERGDETDKPSNRKRKRNLRETGSVSNTLTSGLPLATVDNPMAPPQKKQKKKGASKQAGLVNEHQPNPSLMGAPMPTTVQPLGGQYNTISIASTDIGSSLSMKEGSYQTAQPAAVYSASISHSAQAQGSPVGASVGVSVPLPSYPPLAKPNSQMVSQQTHAPNQHSVDTNINQFHQPAMAGFFQELSTAPTFNFPDTATALVPHQGYNSPEYTFTNMFDERSHQETPNMISADNYTHQTSPEGLGHTDLMLPSKGSRIKQDGYENSDTDSDTVTHRILEDDDDDVQKGCEDASLNEDLDDEEPSHQPNLPFLRPDEIDEQSPSKDERQAEAVVQRSQDNLPVVPPSTDVVSEHRQRNRANQPPSEERLLAAARKQLQSHEGSESEDETDIMTVAPGGGPPEDNRDCRRTPPADEDENPNPGRFRRARNSLNTGNTSSPNNLAYYPEMWKAAMQDAKLVFDKIILLETGFPTKEADLALASQCLSSVIAEFRDQGRVFEAGFSQNRAMDGIVFAEGATYRGKLKTMAAEAVKVYYHSDLNPTQIYKNQQGLYTEISENVERLVGVQSMFHKHGVDEQGKVNNLMHPCIRDLCIKFIYSKDYNGIANHFPDDFKDIIPARAVALVTTAIRNALDEYKDGYFIKKPFKRDDYYGVYQAILQTIDLLNNNPHHHAKWTECRRQWAHMGSRLVNRSQESGEPLFTVSLD
ncbi:hypothetical protein CPB83DRAFT_932321 [Crepidotus variabilis]|uniref:non-specific serine/threonine protein kinase n=1 Tax=Crepidotus variabilis TaxID=179855 RepID=A0A9P6JPA8_9AGAR|nr:hypothetical protein CPB83DRAFT_932321 [Crepidotus variabilis]